MDTWLGEVLDATWSTPNDIKARYPHASFLAGNRVIFNIKGGNYRLVVVVRSVTGAVLIESPPRSPQLDASRLGLLGLLGGLRFEFFDSLLDTFQGVFEVLGLAFERVEFLLACHDGAEWRGIRR